MHLVLLQFKRNVVVPQLMGALIQSNRLTVITEKGARQQFPEEVDVRYLDNSRDLEQSRCTLMDIARRHPVDRLITPFESNQLAGGYLRSLCGIPGRDFETANRCANKLAMKLCYQASALPTATFEVAHGLQDVGRAAAAIGWPVVVKPVLGGGSRHVVMLTDQLAWLAFLETEQARVMDQLGLPYIVERKLQVLAEYHADGVVVDSHLAFWAGSRYLAPLLGCPPESNGSYFLPDDSEDARAIRVLHEAALAAVGLKNGVTHMEFFRTPEGYLAGEIAARTAGGGIPEAIRLRNGVDFWLADFDIACGREPILTSNGSQRILLNYLLPLKAGVVKAISPAECLAALPGVLKVELTTQVGDIVADDLNASSSSGIVYLTVDHEHQIDAAVKQIIEAFRLDVESQS